MKISALLPLLIATVVHASELTSLLDTSGTRAAFMSGKHGIGYRVPGGVNFATAYYDATNFANQIKDLPISYVIIGLSSGAFGDRYLAPHSVLTDLARGSTPIEYTSTSWTITDFTIEDYADRDLFDEILTAMANINVNVIAYMAAQGPAMLKAGEIAAYDYNNKSPYVDSCVECPQYGFTGCDCAPSVHKWKNWVKTNSNYGSDDDAMLQKAYAEVIVNEYAERYGNRIAGWWFDQGDARYANGALVEQIIHQHNPNAAIAWNNGNKVPLRNNNPGIEDFTFGHITPLKSGANPSDGCYNYGMVLAAEDSINGYVYKDFRTLSDDGTEIFHNGASTYDYAVKSDPATRPSQFLYNSTSSEGSLAHVYMPLNIAWNSGGIIWDKHQGAEWMKRVTDAGGAFTWSVARSGCAGCAENIQNGVANQDEINAPDLAFLQEVYNLAGSMGSNYTYIYDDTNCKCCTTRVSNPNYAWGCLETTGYNATCDLTMGLDDVLNTYAPTPQPEETLPPKPECDASGDKSIEEWYTLANNGAKKGCSAWIYGGGTPYARCSQLGTGGTMANFASVNGYEACPYHCGCCATQPSTVDNSEAYTECPNLAQPPATLAPTPSPTQSPTPAPTSSPTPSPTPAPTSSPTPSPTTAPTSSPTPSPTPAPTSFPTPSPTTAPTSSPTPSPTTAPTSSPTPSPTTAPTSSPTPSPTTAPTSSPTPSPTPAPTPSPTPSPTPAPTPSPTPSPTTASTSSPTPSPTTAPTSSPTPSPTTAPTSSPTPSPTTAPTSTPNEDPGNCEGVGEGNNGVGQGNGCGKENNRGSGNGVGEANGGGSNKGVGDANGGGKENNRGSGNRGLRGLKEKM